MNVVDFWFILWGIFIGFGLQVIYDGISEYPHISRKLWGGILMLCILLDALLILAHYSLNFINFLWMVFAVFSFSIVGFGSFVRVVFYRSRNKK